MAEDPKPRFDVGDIVRLRVDVPHLGFKTDDYGVAWGIYEGLTGLFEGDPIVYEADFVDRDRSGCAHMFADDEVDRVECTEDTPLPKRIEEERRWLLGLAPLPSR